MKLLHYWLTYMYPYPSSYGNQTLIELVIITLSSLTLQDWSRPRTVGIEDGEGRRMEMQEGGAEKVRV